jgi:hypothetical protein
LVSGDHYQLPTRVLEIAPGLAKSEEFLKYLAEPPTDYDPARRTGRVRGSFVVKVPARHRVQGSLGFPPGPVS